MQVPFAIQSYKSKSLPVSAQRCVNMYAESQIDGAKNNVAVFGSPGLVLFATCGLGPIRGLWIMNELLYVVSGGFLYSVTSTGVVTRLGGTISGTEVVSMADNGTQLCIVNSEFGYIYSVTGGFTRITSVNFHPADTVTFFDNYFVFNWTGTNKIFISETLDGTTFNALDFSSAEVNPDHTVAVVNQQENLLIFGKRVIETWYDSGDVNFPFNRYDGATIERGCGASLTPIKEDNSVFFLGEDRIFYRLNGVIPTRISTFAIEQEWNTYSIVSDAFTFVHTWAGHKFIYVTFPTANSTWAYDIATNLWHERISSIGNNPWTGRWRGQCAATVYNKVLIGDAYTGAIGYLSDSTYDEYSNTVIAYLVGPVIHSDRKRVRMNKFELDMETGVGLPTGQGSDPQVMLDWSNDGGRSFTLQQQWQSLGAIGAYTKRLRWMRLGQFRNRVMRVTISDPVTRTVIANSVDLKVGTS